MLLCCVGYGYLPSFHCCQNPKYDSIFISQIPLLFFLYTRNLPHCTFFLHSALLYTYLFCKAWPLTHFLQRLPHYAFLVKPDSLHIYCEACLITHFFRSRSHYIFLAKTASLPIYFKVYLFTHLLQGQHCYSFLDIYNIFNNKPNIDLEGIYNFILPVH